MIGAILTQKGRHHRLAAGSIASVTLAATALGLLLPGSVGAATETAGTQTIHACYAKRSGALRVRGARGCKPSQRPISWNRVGPQGPQGPQGPSGTFGSVTVESVSMTVDAGSLNLGTATCPTGDIATGGGGSLGSGNGSGVAANGVAIQTSRPEPVTGTPTGWFVIFANPSGENLNADVYVICASH